MDHRINFRILLEACKNKHPTSQSKLYEYFYGYGMNISLRYTDNYSEAEEILNDAFLVVFKNLHKYDPQYPFKAWFRKIIVNKAIDHFRSSKKYKTHIVLQEEAFRNLGEDYSPPIDPSEDVLPIVQQLSPMYRLVFNLYVVEEYKHHEIAEMLNISVGTSKSNLARAKKKLKALFHKKKTSIQKIDKG